MKKFISRVQNLSQRAAELKAAIQSVPPKVAEIREAMAMTTGQLKQLRTEVESSLADLKADNEDRLMESLHEINGSAEVFHQAGYEVGGVDMELSPVQRLVVHLNRMEDAHKSQLRSLQSANQHRKFTHALLRAIIQAEEMADQVDLTNLVYYKLIVHVGPIPSVRLCWKTEEEMPASQPVAAETAATTVAPQPAATSAFATYGKSSFFERRAPQAAVASARTAQGGKAQTEPTSDQSAEPGSPASATAKDWGKESLERFKKMPGVSKYRR